EGHMRIAAIDDGQDGRRVRSDAGDAATSRRQQCEHDNGRSEQPGSYHRILAPNWKARGSPTAVACPNVGDGFDGYTPVPKLPFPEATFTRLVTLTASSSASALSWRPRGNVRLRRRFSVKKSGPVPALRGMNAPFTIGRPVVPCTVVTPDVMLKGSAEHACS